MKDCTPRLSDSDDSDDFHRNGTERNGIPTGTSERIGTCRLRRLHTLHKFEIRFSRALSHRPYTSATLHILGRSASHMTCMFPFRHPQGLLSRRRRDSREVWVEGLGREEEGGGRRRLHRHKADAFMLCEHVETRKFQLKKADAYKIIGTR